MKKLILTLLLTAGAAQAGITPVCDRTEAVRDFLVKATGKPCHQIGEGLLAPIKRVAVNEKKLTELRVGDFDGLPALEIVNVVGNQLSTLPAGIFAGNPNLKTLVLFDNPLVDLPPDFLADNLNLENLHAFAIPLKHLGQAVIDRMVAMKNLKVIDLSTYLDAAERAELRQHFPERGKVELTFYDPPSDMFVPVCDRQAPIQQFLVSTLHKACGQITPAELSQVKRIAVARKGLTTIQPTDLQGLPNLEILNIKSNQLATVPEGIFPRLPALKTLVILGNPLTSLPDDFLAGNPKLENLHMFRVKLTSLSEKVYERLAAMKNLRVLDIGQSLSQADQDRLRKMFPENGKV